MNDKIDNFIELAQLAAVVANIPVASGVLDKLFERAKEKRTRIFMEEIKSERLYLTDEIVAQERIISYWLITYAAAMRTESREKIRRFARIFKRGIYAPQSHHDKVELYTHILEELTEIDLMILMELERRTIEAEKAADHNNIPGKVAEMHINVAKELIKNAILFDLTPEILRARLTRLAGTGLYDGSLGLVGTSPAIGKLSDLYYDFADWTVGSAIIGDV